jgi:hypothetical protein
MNGILLLMVIRHAMAADLAGIVFAVIACHYVCGK